ncbi:hypothetical protein E4N74_07280 [Treponema putidum]|uniref:Lipoprotein-associated type-17 domain-containing protein n=2 Tax=Treponema putidum TaxID=221027 RepID=A0AAE9SHF5_9SPIR|nr:hypothetical protein E4N74_07280 [Treponema putidum]
MEKKEMKNITKLILSALLLLVLSITGCPQTGTSSGAENQGTNPAVPQNPDELVEADVLTAFGLQRGKITASAAAKKIENSSPTGGITFTEKTAVSYDDEAGTFTVKVKGTKNGKEFEKEITVSGFVNPYAANPESVDTTDDKGELNLDEGIEHNHSIEKYAEKANADIKNFFKAPLTFSLVNGTSVTLGDSSGYTLTATLEKEGLDKVKIVPVYTVKNHKKTADGTPTVTPETKYSVFPAKFEANLTKPYFTEKDVFAYVLKKTPDSVIKVYADEFASAFYAFTKLTEFAPDNLFDTTAIALYTALYQTKDTDEYMALDITCGVANPKNGGIDADDYKGELTVQFCIATNEMLADPGKITASREIKKTGFANIPDDAALATPETHLFFNLLKKHSLSSTDETKWEKEEFSKALLRINESGAAVIANPFGGSSSLFNLFVNGSDPNPAVYLGSAGAAYGGASKTRNNKVIFIEHIQLVKKAGNKSLEVQVTLKGSRTEPLKVIATPDY